MAIKTTKAYIIGLVWAVSTDMALACTAPEPPQIPDPASAVLPEMVKAQNDVKRYLAEGEDYLKCEKTPRKHNAMVEEMREVGDAFNKAIREFKALVKKK